MNTPQGDPPADDADQARISTGCSGLDDVLGGGFDPERMYLYEGRPGSGKTTLALQFLLEDGRELNRAFDIVVFAATSLGHGLHQILVVIQAQPDRGEALPT